MRCLPGLALLMLTATCFTATAQTPEPPKHTVYLNDMVLEELRTSKPSHYERARKVMAEMSTLCEPGPWQSRQLQDRLQAKCSALLLYTSNPPKRQVSFQVDDTLYIANVVLKQAQARAHRLN